MVLEFLNAYADVNVRLVLADQVINLTDDHIDVAVRIGKLPDSSMVAQRLGAIGWMTCASPGYLHARGTPGTPGELDRHDCVAFEGLYSSASWSFTSQGGPLALPIRPRLAVNTADAAISAAIAGSGITRVLSYQVAAAVGAGTLRLILAGYSPEALPVHLVHTAQSLLPLTLRAFLDFATPRLKAILAP